MRGGHWYVGSITSLDNCHVTSDRMPELLFWRYVAHVVSLARFAMKAQCTFAADGVPPEAFVNSAKTARSVSPGTVSDCELFFGTNVPLLSCFNTGACLASAGQPSKEETVNVTFLELMMGIDLMPASSTDSTTRVAGAVPAFTAGSSARDRAFIAQVIAAPAIIATATAPLIGDSTIGLL